MSLRIRGVSLAEFLVAMAVVSILAAVAAPAYDGLSRRTRLAVATNDLLAMIYLTRSEALKRGDRATACVSITQERCTPSRSPTAGWHQGWIVFDDANDNGDRDPSEILIVTEPARKDRVTIKGNFQIVNRLSYVASGLPQQIGGARQMGTFTICEAGEARFVVLNYVGRVRVTTGRC